MLRRLRARGYKSLSDIDIALPQLTVLFGPNSAGKSNLIDAISLLASTARERTLSDALTSSVRGYPFEQLSLPTGGLPELLRTPLASFTLGAEVAHSPKELYDYHVTVSVEPATGMATVADEYLALLTKDGQPRGMPAISREGNTLRIRRKGKPAHPREEPIGLNHTQLSDTRWSGDQYAWIERTRHELSHVRTYYLDPRIAMRQGTPPKEAGDIGPSGSALAPFLFGLKSKHPESFRAVTRALKSVIPTIEQLSVDLDDQRGLLDIKITQDGVDYSSRVLSEGTMRVLALCAIAADPVQGGVVAFEEPENGVHPRRLELVARILFSMVLRSQRQVIVTSHSALFCEQMLTLKRQHPSLIDLVVVGRTSGATQAKKLIVTGGALFDDQELTEGLSSDEDGWFEDLVIRGLVDA